MTARDRLFRIADRLGRVPSGSTAADETIHQALGRAGQAPLYTTDMEAARTLLPPGFVEIGDPTYMTDAVYAACRRVGIDAGGLPYPHHGGWGATLPLALCHASTVGGAPAGVSSGRPFPMDRRRTEGEIKGRAPRNGMAHRHGT